MAVRSDLVEHAAGLLNRGDLKGALRQYVTLFEGDPNNWTVANTLGDLYVRVGRADAAAAHFMSVAERLAADGFSAKARALYRKILRIQPDNELAMKRVEELDTQTGAVSPFLQRVLTTARAARETRTQDAAVCLEAPPEPVHVTTPVALRLPAATSERALRDDWTPIHIPDPVPLPPMAPPVAAPLATPPAPFAAPSVEAPPIEPPPIQPVTITRIANEPVAVPSPCAQPIVAPAPSGPAAAAELLKAEPLPRVETPAEDAIARLEQQIADGITRGLGSLKLLELQVRLAEACLNAGRFQQAQDIALDAISREPGDTTNLRLLTRVRTTASMTGRSLREVPPPDLLSDSGAPPIARQPVVEEGEKEEELVVVDDTGEYTFNAPAVPAAEAEVAETADPAFEELRRSLIEDAAAAAEEHYAEAGRRIDAGQVEQAISLLEDVMCVPHLRTPAGTRLAAVYRDRGTPIEALACLEWVAELPPANEESGHALAYELALTLEAMGEHAQALGVYRELLSEVGPHYRDVAARIEGLAA